MERRAVRARRKRHRVECRARLLDLRERVEFARGDRHLIRRLGADRDGVDERVVMHERLDLQLRVKGHLKRGVREDKRADAVHRPREDLQHAVRHRQRAHRRVRERERARALLHAGDRLVLHRAAQHAVRVPRAEGQRGRLRGRPVVRDVRNARRRLDDEAVHLLVMAVEVERDRRALRIRPNLHDARLLAPRKDMGVPHAEERAFVPRNQDGVARVAPDDVREVERDAPLGALDDEVACPLRHEIRLLPGVAEEIPVRAPGEEADRRAGLAAQNDVPADLRRGRERA